MVLQNVIESLSNNWKFGQNLYATNWYIRVSTYLDNVFIYLMKEKNCYIAQELTDLRKLESSGSTVDLELSTPDV